MDRNRSIFQNAVFTYFVLIFGTLYDEQIPQSK